MLSRRSTTMAVAGPARFPEKRSRLCPGLRGQEVDVPVVVVIAPRQLDRPFHPPSLLDRQCRLVVAENHVFAPGAVLGARVDIDVGADARRLDPRDRHQHARALERRFVAEAGAKRPAAAEKVAIAQVGRNAAGGDPLVEQRLVLVRRFEAVQEQEAARLLDGDHGVNGHHSCGRRRRRRWLERHFGGPEGADVIEPGVWWIRPARGWPAPPPESASPVPPARRACSRRPLVRTDCTR